jgi:hypothetical protein
MSEIYFTDEQFLGNVTVALVLQNRGLEWSPPVTNLAEMLLSFLFVCLFSHFPELCFTFHFLRTLKFIIFFCAPGCEFSQ